MSEALRALLHLFDHEYSWLAQFFSLLVLPFAHEDLAIILGGYIVVNDIMPVALVAFCIYGGMVASDFALYGIGAGARHLPWLTRLAVNDRVRGFSDVLRRNLFGIVALCRTVPGFVFIAFIACGWTRVSLVQFTVASLAVSALYLPLMLCIVVFFGSALDDHAGLWAWPFVLCLLVGIGFVRRQIFAFHESARARSSARSAGAASRLGASDSAARARQRALAERIPRRLLYLPIILSWIGLALRYRSLTLPTAANPRKATGGRWGESKSDYLLDVAGNERRWIADFVVVKRSSGAGTLYSDLESVRQAMCAAGLSFPLVAKPDRGCDPASRIEDAAALRECLRSVPAGEKLILQRFVPHASDAVALYARMPGAPSGRVLSLCFGPGANGEARTLARDPSHCVSPELEARLDAIARSMREFHYGHFRLRFACCDELMRGENFSVVEINGIGRGNPDLWNHCLPASEICRRSIERQRILFLIGGKNRERGFAPLACADLLRSLVEQSQLGGRYRGFA